MYLIVMKNCTCTSKWETRLRRLPRFPREYLNRGPGNHSLSGRGSGPLLLLSRSPARIFFINPAWLIFSWTLEIQGISNNLEIDKIKGSRNRFVQFQSLFESSLCLVLVVTMVDPALDCQHCNKDAKTQTWGRGNKDLIEWFFRTGAILVASYAFLGVFGAFFFRGKKFVGDSIYVFCMSALRGVIT